MYLLETRECFNFLKGSFFFFVPTVTKWATPNEDTGSGLGKDHP